MEAMPGFTGAAVGHRVKEAREAMRISQVELAEAIGVERSYLSRLEKGERPLSAANLVAIANELGRLGSADPRTVILWLLGGVAVVRFQPPIMNRVGTLVPNPQHLLPGRHEVTYLSLVA